MFYYSAELSLRSESPLSPSEEEPVSVPDVSVGGSCTFGPELPPEEGSLGTEPVFPSLLPLLLLSSFGGGLLELPPVGW